MSQILGTTDVINREINTREIFEAIEIPTIIENNGVITVGVPSIKVNEPKNRHQLAYELYKLLIGAEWKSEYPVPVGGYTNGSSYYLYKKVSDRITVKLQYSEIISVHVYFTYNYAMIGFNSTFGNSSDITSGTYVSSVDDSNITADEVFNKTNNMILSLKDRLVADLRYLTDNVEGEEIL